MESIMEYVMEFALKFILKSVLLDLFFKNHGLLEFSSDPPLGGGPNANSGRPCTLIIVRHVGLHVDFSFTNYFGGL
jgi:hypothetical protein